MRLALIALLTLTACSERPAAEPTPRPAAKVKVLTGDTFVLRGQTVRLANAVAPRLPPHAKCWAEGALAVQSATWARRALDRAETLDVTYEDIDDDGIRLVRIRTASDLGNRMIEAGVAAVRTDAGWDWCAPPDYSDERMPGFAHGPGENVPFMVWLREDYLQRSGSQDEGDDLVDAARDAGF